MPDCDNNVAILHTVFPHEAAKIRRLMGFRKVEDDTKVTKMKTVPTSEKQDATRSTVSRDLSWLGVRLETIFYQDRRAILERAQQCLCANRKSIDLQWLPRQSINEIDEGDITQVWHSMAQYGTLLA